MHFFDVWNGKYQWNFNSRAVFVYGC